jgi:hypothetical protein
MFIIRITILIFILSLCGFKGFVKESIPRDDVVLLLDETKSSITKYIFSNIKKNYRRDVRGDILIQLITSDNDTNPLDIIGEKIQNDVSPYLEILHFLIACQDIENEIINKKDVFSKSEYEKLKTKIRNQILTVFDGIPAHYFILAAYDSDTHIRDFYKVTMLNTFEQNADLKFLTFNASQNNNPVLKTIDVEKKNEENNLEIPRYFLLLIVAIQFFLIVIAFVFISKTKSKLNELFK